MKRLIARLYFAVILGVTICLATCALGQSDRGSISGVVQDNSGAVVANAAIQITRTETGVQRNTVTTSTGVYTAPELPAGIYSISVTAPGFRKYVQSGVTVQVAQPLTLNIVLQVGAVDQVTQVVADANMLKTEDQELSTSITGDKLDELPIDFSSNIRNPQGFYKLIPGASVNTDSSWPTTNQNGLQSFAEEIRIDGAS